MQFPGVLANDDVSFDIKKGEVFALVGENGAGKSTLMNILYGINTPTNGNVYIKGNKMEKHTPSESIENGVGMVHSTSCWYLPLLWRRISPSARNRESTSSSMT